MCQLDRIQMADFRNNEAEYFADYDSSYANMYAQDERKQGAGRIP